MTQRTDNFIQGFRRRRTRLRRASPATTTVIMDFGQPITHILMEAADCANRRAQEM